MSVVHMIDDIRDWAQTNICDKIQLKQPPVDLDAPTDAGYEHKLVTPTAFAMYVPTSDKLPPKVHAPFPCLCVRPANGEDSLANESGFAIIQLCFSAWDPGTHGEDILHPVGGLEFERWSGEEADAYFRRHGEGWRDAWNFLDIGRRALESVTNIRGFVIDRNTPIKWGPMDEQISIPDHYPTWFAWVSFRVNYPLVRNIEDLQDFL